MRGFRHEMHMIRSVLIIIITIIVLPTDGILTIR